MHWLCKIVQLLWKTGNFLKVKHAFTSSSFLGMYAREMKTYFFIKKKKLFVEELECHSKE
jgi:hypothetical protein